MRKAFAALLVFFLILFLPCLSADADNRSFPVYIAVGSKSAYRYHASENCSSLNRSTVEEVTLEDAAMRGFTPCTRCHPPAPDFDITVTPRPITGSSGPGAKENASEKRKTDGALSTPWFYIYLTSAGFLCFGLPLLAEKRKVRLQEKRIEQKSEYLKEGKRPQ